MITIHPFILCVIAALSICGFIALYRTYLPKDPEFKVINGVKYPMRNGLPVVTPKPVRKEKKIIHVIELTNGKQYTLEEGLKLVDEGEWLAIYSDDQNVRIQQKHIVSVKNFI